MMIVLLSTLFLLLIRRYELDTLKCTQAWRGRLMELTETVENRLLGFLNSGWLKGNMQDDDCVVLAPVLTFFFCVILDVVAGSVTKSPADHALRQMYIPEAVLRLHRIQHYTKDLGHV
jgi:hypothetical protein